MNIIILGKGGHAKVLEACWNPWDWDKVVYVDKEETVPKEGALVVGVGDLKRRKLLFNQYRNGRYFPLIAHPNAIFNDNDEGIAWGGWNSDHGGGDRSAAVLHRR